MNRVKSMNRMNKSMYMLNITSWVHHLLSQQNDCYKAASLHVVSKFPKIKWSLAIWHVNTFKPITLIFTNQPGTIFEWSRRSVWFSRSTVSVSTVLCGGSGGITRKRQETTRNQWSFVTLFCLNSSTVQRCSKCNPCDTSSLWKNFMTDSLSWFYSTLTLCKLLRRQRLSN